MTFDEWSSATPSDTQTGNSASLRLHHYTNIGALLGIVNTRTVWAADPYFLNDETEFRHGRKLLFGELDRKIEQLRGSDKDCLTMVREQLDFHSPRLRIFVFSLSVSEDSLSQWRAYGGDAGVCIAFQYDKIRNSAQQAGGRLVKCVYCADDKQRLSIELVERTLQKLQFERDRGLRVEPFALSAVFPFIHLAASFKNSAFHEENEWRILTPNLRSQKFRVAGTILRPYSEISILQESLEDPPKLDLGFDLITVGPGPRKDLMKHSIEVLLQDRSIPAQVVFSNVPYRAV